MDAIQIHSYWLMPARHEIIEKVSEFSSTFCCASLFRSRFHLLLIAIYRRLRVLGRADWSSLLTNWKSWLNWKILINRSGWCVCVCRHPITWQVSNGDVVRVETCAVLCCPFQLWLVLAVFEITPLHYYISSRCLHKIFGSCSSISRTKPFSQSKEYSRRSH